jgi:hypothetical protein
MKANSISIVFFLLVLFTVSIHACVWARLAGIDDGPNGNNPHAKKDKPLFEGAMTGN